MKTLTDFFKDLGLGLMLLMSSGGYLYHATTYDFARTEISKFEKEGKQCAKDYCKKILSDSYYDSKFMKIVNGRDDAAREYLEFTELNK